jgi:hypothetical protein
MVLVECARAWRAKYLANALDALVLLLLLLPPPPPPPPPLVAAVEWPVTRPPQVLHQRSTLDQGAFILSPIALLFACFVAVPLLHQVLACAVHEVT